MATKAKASTIVGKEKKALPSSNLHITSTKRSTKPPTTTTITNSTNKANSTPSNKNTPNYLKPTVSSHPKRDNPNNKPTQIRRRSLDKPLSSSNLTKRTQPSHSRLHKALVSPGPRERSTSLRSSVGSLNKSTNSAKPILDGDKTSKTTSDAKTKPLVTKSTKKSTPSVSTSTTTKKVANNNGHASPNSTKSTTEETLVKSSVENEQVKEVTTSQEVEEVIKVENEEQKHEVEHVTDISPDVDSEHEIIHVHYEVNNSDPPHDQVNDERVISTVSEAEEADHEPLEEEHVLEEESTNQAEGNNNESNHKEEHYVAEREVTINEEEDKDENKNEGEGEDGVIVIDDHKSENNNNKEDVVEEKKEEVEEAKVEPTQSNQQLEAKEKGNKKESQVSNDVIEETASKLLEARKNKVRALAGAFQTVIDHQTTSK